MQGFALCLFFSACATAQTRPYKPSTYHLQKVTLFRSLPERPGAIIFLGNSITDGGEWAELTGRPDVLNRGISSDVTRGVLERLDEVVRHQPQKVFLMIGTNDLARGVQRTQIVANILEIVRRLKAEAPGVSVYVQSVLPLNDTFDKYPEHHPHQANILWLNAELQKAAPEAGYTYLDVASLLMDRKERLRADYTNDGLHLMGPAYVAWAAFLKPYL